jgi:hypothetical protein
MLIMIEYDEYELIELFGSIPKVIDKEVGIYEYEHLDIYEFKCNLHFCVYDEYCSISLYYKNFANPVFDLGFNNIEKIRCANDKLIIQQKNNPEDIVIYFKPTYTLKFEERGLQ